MVKFLSNLTATFSNSGTSYNAISMMVSASAYDPNSKIISLGANGETKFAVYPNSTAHLKSTGPVLLVLEADTDNVTETDNPSIRFIQDSAIVKGRVGFESGNNSLEIMNEFADALYLGTSNTRRVAIDSSGNFGVGVNVPLRGFHLANPSEASMLLDFTGGLADKRKWRIYSAAAAGLAANLNIDLLNDATNSVVTNPITIEGASGNVSINTKIKTPTLEVNNITVTGTIGGLENSTTTISTSNVSITGTNFGGKLSNVKVFTADGTYTKPTGVRFIKVTAVGGGGGGGGSTSSLAANVSIGSGGAGGDAVIAWINAAAITTVSITIGAGGAGGSGTSGSSGGDTLFGNFFTVSGGGPGSTLATGNTVAVLNPADSGSTTSVNVSKTEIVSSVTFDGQPGSVPIRCSGTSSMTGSGGNSILGSGIRGRSGATNGDIGTGYGAGGSGSRSSGNVGAFTGGDGTDGIVIIEEHH